MDPLFVLVVVILATCIFVCKITFSHAGKCPPGSLGWPIIGETMKFLSERPEKFIGERMKKYSSDVFRSNLFGETMAVFCGPKGNKFLFSNEQKLVQVWHPHSMDKLFNHSSSPTPNIHQMGSIFSQEAVIKDIQKIDLITKHHLNTYWQGKEDLHAYPLIRSYTLALTCQLFLGVDDEARITKLIDKFNKLNHGLHTMPWNIPGTRFFRAKKAASAILNELQLVIKEKKILMENGVQMNDLLAHMIRASQHGKLNLPNGMGIEEVFMGIISAGYTAPSATLAFSIKYIAENPHVYQNILTEVVMQGGFDSCLLVPSGGARILTGLSNKQLKIKSSKGINEALDWDDIQKMKYTWNVICETMRLTPPLQGTFREAIADFTFAGFTIPKGWKIYWTASSTNKNSNYFPNPEKFLPSRFEKVPEPYTFTPFGGGPRMCPGKEFARVLMLIFLHNLVIEYKWQLVCPNEQVLGDMTPMLQFGLPIRLSDNHN